MEKNLKVDEHPQSDGFSPVASTGDFTGLIPAGLNSDEELHAYEEIYAFVPPAKVETKSTKNTGK
jgi:hypothetical protein